MHTKQERLFSWNGLKWWVLIKNPKLVTASTCRATCTEACIYGISGRFEPRCCGFQGLQVRVWAFVTVHASPGATAGLWQQPLQISHSCVTNSWPRNSAEASYLQTHPHIHTTCELSESTPLSNTEAVKWDYNSACSRLLAPSTLTIYPPSSISVILLLAWLQSLRSTLQLLRQTRCGKQILSANIPWEKC